MRAHLCISSMWYVKPHSGLSDWRETRCGGGGCVGRPPRTDPSPRNTESVSAPSPELKRRDEREISGGNMRRAVTSHSCSQRVFTAISHSYINSAHVSPRLPPPPHPLQTLRCSTTNTQDSLPPVSCLTPHLLCLVRVSEEDALSSSTQPTWNPPSLLIPAPTLSSSWQTPLRLL